MSSDSILQDKVDYLLKGLSACKAPLVMFSGGVDSTVLAAAAKRASSGRVAVFTAISPTMPQAEVEEARSLAAALGIEHVEFYIDETEKADFAANDKDRCYYCKRYRLDAVADWAKKNGFDCLLEGSNADDLLDYRPGMRALKERPEVGSPLKDCGFTKADIRETARIWGLAVWDKPAAACLASRLSYGIPITKERLRAIEEAELIVRECCPAGSVRVRHHGGLARIEVEKEYLPLLAAPAVAGVLARRLRALGFSFVALDLDGYSTGSLNKLIAEKEGGKDG